MNPERKVEIKLWNWFINSGVSVDKIFFNSKNEVSCPTFSVTGNIRTKPDLLIRFINPYTKEMQYMVVEVKDASKSGNVRSGTKVFEEYLINYVNEDTKYLIDGEVIKINHFAIATQFSPEGKLMKNEVIVCNESMRGLTMKNIVPNFEYSQTKELHRGMIHSFSKYRKDGKLDKKERPSIGVIISDLLTKFDSVELKLQGGVEGLPVYQAVTFNERRGRWTQCMMKM
jgi:hypothetical protein